MRRPLLVTVLVLLGAACGSDPAPPSDAPATATTCVSAPATTAMGQTGGGEVVCGPEPAADGSGPETTVPDP